MEKKSKILIVAAHPDDEVLGCGASMAKWSNLGHDVNVLIMAEGATSRDNKRNRKKRAKELSILSESAKQSAMILGINSIQLLNYPDNRMDSVDFLEVVKSVENQIEIFKPNLVLTHHAGDLNIDHRIIHQAVITACRPIKGHSVKRILSFEVPSATDWQSPNYGRPFVPNWFEDINDTLSLKLKALDLYKSEMQEWPNARSIKALEYLARWRGSTVGCEAAEAFMLIREIN
jgi:N-acetylglucosamine malate deacetylase 1